VLVGAGLAAVGLMGYAAAGAYPAVPVSAGLRAAGVALAWPALTAVLADAAPPESRGFVMAIFGEFESVGLALGPLIGGFVAVRFGYGAALGGMAWFVALGGVAGLAMGRRSASR
jgi:MFS family permease